MRVLLGPSNKEAENRIIRNLPLPAVAFLTSRKRPLARGSAVACGGRDERL